MNNLIQPSIETFHRKRRWPWVLLVAVVIVAMSVVGWYVRAVNVPAVTASEDTIANVQVTIEEGSSVDEIIAQFDALGMIRSPLVFKLYARLNGTAASLKAGVYTLPTVSSTRDIIRHLASGGSDTDEVTIRIIEGWTSQQIEDHLIEQGLNAQDFVETVQLTQPQFDADYFTTGLPNNAGAEGYLFPDTYSVYRDSTPEEIVQKMLTNFEKRVASKENKAFAEQSTRSFYELLTVASIVERELQNSRDREIGAGIFLQRLNDAYPLESDATINYITGKSTTRPTASDLEQESPYNTYKQIGLPPTPISNPGLDAIRAALNPTKTDYYFFLHTPSGETIFSETFEEHVANKVKYYPN